MSRFVKVFLVFIVIISSTTIAYSVVFPQPVRCMLIDFYDFEKTGNLYYRAGINADKKKELISLIGQAEDRVDSFWNGKQSDPTFIYCERDEDYMKFGVPFMTPAAAILTIKSFVVLSKDGIDLDIISHELSHAELAKRIGFLDREMKIPTWFDEGLAMQVDRRPYYSIDSLKEKSNNFQELVDVKQLKTGSQFGGGTREDVMLNYLTAKYELSKWYSKEKLEKFISNINNGDSFYEAY